MNVRKLFILLPVLFLASLVTPAQTVILSVGNTSAMTIKTGTIFSADSLILTPGADLTLSSNNIQVSPVAVNLYPSPGINRIYSLGSPIGFTGTIQLYYQPSELNGNPEGSLKYTDSAIGGSWLAEIASTVNTVTHFVQYAASSSSFIGATVSHQGISLLPVTLISFAGNWNGNVVALGWVVDQSAETVSFDVESCPDGVSWKEIGEVAGQNGNGVFSYTFNDSDPSGNTLYYRLKLLHVSGEFTYSNIVKLQKGVNSNTVRLIVGGNGVSVYFMGEQPTAIRLINVSGQILRADRVSRQEYDLNGLFPGAYFLQYEINGQWSVREFVVQ